VRDRFGPYFCEPVIAGLNEDGSTFISASDLIGASAVTNDFAVSGTSSENLYGMCESLWKPDMDKDTLFETISQALLAAVDRDALSGWGGIVHVM
jgi:20S proteasome subunit beta 3